METSKECKFCGKVFNKRIKESYAQFGAREFCSRKCSADSRANKERIIKPVVIPDVIYYNTEPNENIEAGYKELTIGAIERKAQDKEIESKLTGGKEWLSYPCSITITNFCGLTQLFSIYMWLHDNKQALESVLKGDTVKVTDKCKAFTFYMYKDSENSVKIDLLATQKDIMDFRGY